MPKPLSLLIASIGNPSPYQNTLHSAGHTLLQRLRLLLPDGHPYEPWSLHKGGLLSRPPPQVNKRFTLTGFKNAAEEYPTLWQSGSFMNVSGPAVQRVWEKWREGRAEECALVIVHDELEREMGVVSVKVYGHASAKGHNGIKSIQQSFAGQKFIRIGVGIGRPDSREPKAVADYVLKKMTAREKERIEAAAGKVLSVVTDIQYGTYKG